MNKISLSAFLRKIGLIKTADKMRFYFGLIKTFRSRKLFFRENSGAKLPPAYYIYETFNLNYFSFYNKSIDTAQWLVSHFVKYKTLENVNILDWGCGPGRVIRHMPNFVSNTCGLYGTDYNKKYINWCIKNIPEITFKTNQLKPPLTFENNFFDVIYGISIFTHLSEEMHFAWFKELLRVTKTDGIILLSLQGDAFKTKLNGTECKEYELGKLVIKANTKEGHRTFSAYHPLLFVKNLIDNNELLEHIPGEVNESMPQQDVWIIKKTELY